MSPSTAWRYENVTDSADGSVISKYLVCAWKPTQSGPVFDDRYSKVQMLSVAKNFSKTIEQIDGIYLATKAIDMYAGPNTEKIVMESFTAAGAIASRGFTLDDTTETLSNPVTVKVSPVTSISGVIAAARLAQDECRDYVKELAIGGSLTNDYYNGLQAREYLVKQTNRLNALTQ